jgi:hypothetical protein
MARNAAPSEQGSSEDEQYGSAEGPMTDQATHPHNTRHRPKATSLGGPELLSTEASTGRRDPRQDVRASSATTTCRRDPSQDVRVSSQSHCSKASTRRPSGDARASSDHSRPCSPEHQRRDLLQPRPPSPSVGIEEFWDDAALGVSHGGKNARPTVTQDRPFQTTHRRSQNETQITTQRAQPYHAPEADMLSLGGDEERSASDNSMTHYGFDPHDTSAASNDPGNLEESAEGVSSEESDVGQHRG